MIDLRKYADTKASSSLSNKFRNTRFAHFQQCISSLPTPVSILDIGGTVAYWEQRGWVGRPDVTVTIINLDLTETTHKNIALRTGNATNLAEYPNNSFDVVFSNSVIEHLFTAEHQMQMANEIRRVAKAYWIQTPNYWFPIEPHFLIPGWQWMPSSLRIKLLMKYRCGWKGPIPNRISAALSVNEIRLLTTREMKALFPEAKVWKEKYLLFTKSIVAYAGFDSTAIEKNQHSCTP